MALDIDNEENKSCCKS